MSEPTDRRKSASADNMLSASAGSMSSGSKSETGNRSETGSKPEVDTSSDKNMNMKERIGNISEPWKAGDHGKSEQKGSGRSVGLQDDIPAEQDDKQEGLGDRSEFQGGDCPGNWGADSSEQGDNCPYHGHETRHRPRRELCVRSRKRPQTGGYRRK